MPDNKWWLAQNVKYAQTGQAVSISGCTPEKCGRYYTAAQKSGSYGGTSGNGSNKQGVCPNGWVLPVFSNWTALFNNISSNTSVVCQRLRALNSPCSPRDNYYGWANQMIVSYSSCASSCNDHWHANDTNGSMQRMDHWSNIGNYCNTLEQCNPGALPMTVRCFRQL
jgi:uncharacterized protein (TIGR02145 family)